MLSQVERTGKMVKNGENVQIAGKRSAKAALRFIYMLCALIIGLDGIATAGLTDKGDGTVLDAETGLMWQQQSDATVRTWDAAKSYCENLSIGGYSDWRLPDLKELKSISDPLKPGSVINALFINTYAASYWSTTTCTFDTARKRYVNFVNGNVGTSAKTDALYARCVRRAKSGQ